jgi:pyruvate/2-oxoglutarate dehydrogenase complex dihydrolipoamide acyltransferase (E2) component
MAKLNATDGAIEAAENYGINIKLVKPAKAGGKVTAADVDAYAKSLKKGDTAPAPDAPKEDAPAEKPAAKRKKDLICVLAIKEGSKLYLAGSVYDGKNAEYLLSRGSIKED